MNSNLLPLNLKPLPLGCIEARGWLHCQLKLQADNITRPLEQSWPDVSQSAWIGGSAEGWERGPYWLDGAVALAFTLKDEALIKRVKYWFDTIIAHQHKDGWLGPVKDQRYGEKYRAYDPWPVFVYLKAATQYYEATHDERIIASCMRFLQRLHQLLKVQPLFEWGKSRWPDLLVSVYWFYEATKESWLLELAKILQQQGYDWRAHFADFSFTDKTTSHFGQVTHVVNNAMALKQAALWYRMSHSQADLNATRQMIATLDKYHGQVTGLFTGDEHYAGKNPSQGTETCAVVEYLYSLETILSVNADIELADRLEKIAFNALPASMSPDLKWHQYDQQVNQVQCVYSKENIYTNNGPEANLFGLESNFGCCTANLHQGWPKFTSHLWRSSAKFGLVLLNFAPCRMTLTKEDAQNCGLGSAELSAEVRTNYPFEDLIHIEVFAAEDCPSPLTLRIPAWCSNATLSVNNGNAETYRGSNLITALSHIPKGKTTLALKLPSTAHFVRGYHRSATLVKEPLVYSLAIEEQWSKFSQTEQPDLWEVKPQKPWAYSLNESQLAVPQEQLQFTFQTMGDQQQVFCQDNAPIKVQLNAQAIGNWSIEKNAAGPIPETPQALPDHKASAIELLPYGCTRLRVTEFPVIKD